MRLPLPLRFVARGVRIGGLTTFFGLGFLISRWGREGAGPRCVRRYFETCGGIYIKVGQVLAMRYDLLPVAYCEELSRLLDRVAPEPVEEIVAAIEADLARPLAACYATFDPEPLASASIAQIHTATLHGGEAVVVKVIRPGLERTFRLDFAFLRLFARLFEGRLIFAHVDLPAAVEELVQLTREELDFRREARNLEEAHALMVGDGVGHRCPRIYPELCGRSVVTMERLEGLSVQHLLVAQEAGDPALLAQWRAAGIEPEQVAERILRSLLVQILRHRQFQADPHAANILVAPDGTIGWVDFGMVGWLDEKSWAEQWRLRLAMAAGQIDGAYRSLLATLEPTASGDLGRFEAEIKSYLRDWLAAARSASVTIVEKSAGTFFLRAFGAMRRAGLRVPLGTMRLYRTLIVADIVILKLAPALNFMPILREVLEDEKRRQAEDFLSRLADPSQWGGAIQEFLAGPRLALDLMGQAKRNLQGQPRREPTGLERASALALSWLQIGAALSTVGLLVLRGFGDPFSSTWGALARLALGPAGWPLILAFALATYLFGKLQRELRR